MMSLAGLLGATAELAVILKLKDEITGPLHHAGNSLDAFNRKQGGLSRTGRSIEAGLSGAAGAIEAVAVGAATSVAGLGLFAAHQAQGFQQQMELIKTEAGGTQAEVDTMSQAVLSLSSQVGTGPDELAMGLYHVESAGLRGAQALDILKTAAIGAKVGGADLESVTNALVAAQMSGIGGVQSMTQAMADLDAIVGSGNMRMQDLADSMGTGILGTAKTFGVSLQDVGAALATLTDAGVPAVDAATRLSHTFVMMGAPTAAAQKALKSIGVGQFDLANAMRQPDGIFAALTLLHDHLAKAGDIMANGELSPKGAAVLSKAFGGGRFSATIMQLLGQLDRVHTKYDGIIAQEGEFGDKTVATQQTAAYQWGQFQANLQTIAITFGEQLLPGVNDVIKGLNQIVSANSTKIADFAKSVGGAFGDFIAKLRDVDWGSLAGAFESVAGKVGDIVSAFLHAPQWVQDVLIGGFVANKLTGGFVLHTTLQIGESIIKGLGGGLGSALASAGIGKAFVQPVFVTNMPLGGLGPGGGAAAGAGAGEEVAAGAGAGTALAGAVGIGLVLATGVGLAQSLLDARQMGRNADTLAKQYGLTPAQAAALEISRKGGLPGGSGGQALRNQFASEGTTYQKALAEALAKIAQNTTPGPQLIGEHSALGPQLVTAVNSMENLNTKNSVAFRAGEHADIASVVAAQKQSVATAERKGNEMDSALGTLQARLQGSVQMVGDAIRHLPPPQVHVGGAEVTVNVSTTVNPYSYTRTNTRVNRYGPPVAV